MPDSENVNPKDFPEETSPFTPSVPDLDLSEGADMLKDFSREAQRHLMGARNSLLVLESVASDREARESIFKTFHTIRGLSDFLNLRDICLLTQKAEELYDAVRKDTLTFDGSVQELSNEIIQLLQKLLESLDEQINQGGQLSGDYPDAGPVLKKINQLLSQKASDSKKKPRPVKMPTITYEPDTTLVSLLKERCRGADDRVAVEVDLMKQLMRDYENLNRDLKITQGKLQERQRALIQERELALKLTQQAQAEARAKSEYLASMSHEIRTLINAVIGFTGVLKETRLTSKQREHVNTILMSGEMLLEIVNAILDFAKVEAGKLKLEEIDFHLERNVDDVLKIIRSRLEGKPVELKAKIADDVPRHLIGDPTRFKQILINILDNAIKFTQEGEIALTITSESVEPKEGQGRNERWLTVEVRDTGIGIPKDRQKKIFESFTQADDSTSRLYGGTGLGLALCKTFVETMGGKIWVESEEGQGSRFVFRIPFRLGGAGSVGQWDFSDLLKKPVLVVENREGDFSALKDIFERHQFNLLPVVQQAKPAMDFLSARLKKREELPDIIFIDEQLPDKQGYKLAYRLKQQDDFRHIRLVAVVTNTRVGESDEFKRAGFDTCLVRPFMETEVLEVLTRLIGKKSLADRSQQAERLDKVSLRGIKVLVAEDSVPNQELLKVHFENLGCSCDYASNGAEAVEKLAQGDYDICFMDLQMPVMNGLEAAERIRKELKSSIPIVALTAAEVDEEKERCLAVGMTDYLSKPFGVEELKEKIVKCVKF